MKRAALAGILFIAAWLYAEPAQVRVRLFSIEQPSEIRITTASGETVFINARSLKAIFRSEGPVSIQRGTFAGVFVRYPLEVSARDNKLVIVAELPLEDYVAGVLAGEASGFRSVESLKAMAVAARTYAVHFLDRHKKEGFHFCDSTHCQDLRLTAVNERFRNAAEATRSEILHYEGKAIPAYYHKDCGGITEPRTAYLGQIEDAFCISRERTAWLAEFTAAELQSALGVTEIHDMEIIGRTSSGRAQHLRITGSRTQIVEAEAFRLVIGRTLGWNKIRSDLYQLRRSGERFIFEGHGAGHGIGLCQEGAMIMGDRGHDYREILNYFYPNTILAFFK